MEAKAAARSQTSETTRKPSRILTRPAAPAVDRSSAQPMPLVTTPATMNGCTGSPYASANGMGKSAASPRYFPSIPTRLTTAATSIASRRRRPIRTAAWVKSRSQRLDDPRCVRRLGEDDHAVARLEHVVAVREDRRAVPDECADDRAVHGHVAKRHPDVAARV